MIRCSRRFVSLGLSGVRAVSNGSNSSNTSNIRTEELGKLGTPEYRLFYFKGTNKISPWHDIPLSAQSSSTFNYVNEIPKGNYCPYFNNCYFPGGDGSYLPLRAGTDEKMEIATKEPHNPIKQDVKNGNLRYIKHGKFPFNYGCLPQTWEDPNHVDKDTKCPGDNDPLDVVEIGGVKARGAVYAVKPLGVLALIDEEETDWKLIAIDATTTGIDSIQDVETKMPGLISEIREWFRLYKVIDGKKPNSFGFDERILDQTKALQVIEETHNNWKSLKPDQSKLWKKD